MLGSIGKALERSRAFGCVLIRQLFTVSRGDVLQSMIEEEHVF